VSRRIAFQWEGRTVEASLETNGGNAVLSRDGRELAATFRREDRRIELETAGGLAVLAVVPGARDVWVAHKGHVYRLERPQRERPGASAESSTDEIRAPMTGRVVKVAAVPGAIAREGELLLTIEAMKMEFRLTAPEDGNVAEVHCAEGDQVELGQLLVRLTPAGGGAAPSAMSAPSKETP
jgi:acetyl/propionyl-CoA carboxylase alpha subunit